MKTPSPRGGEAPWPRKIHRTQEGTSGPYPGGYIGKANYRTQEGGHGPPITVPRRGVHYLDATHLRPRSALWGSS
jgi:hypothetical protein